MLLDDEEEIYFSGFKFSVPEAYIPDPQEFKEKLDYFDAVDCYLDKAQDHWNVEVIAFGVFFETVDQIIVDLIATKIELAYLLKINPFDDGFKFLIGFEIWY